MSDWKKALPELENVHKVVIIFRYVQEGLEIRVRRNDYMYSQIITNYELSKAEYVDQLVLQVINHMIEEVKTNGPD